ncbi:MAG: NADH-quinone oxidoreductase subunit N [Leptospiraceae bacterium]|nr:NADH-quinone oxidoreductase subunit N [Leptospiraceae bacterium]
MNNPELYYLLPFWLTVAGSLALLFNEAFFKEGGRGMAPAMAALFSLAALAAACYQLWGPSVSVRLFSNTLKLDTFALGISAAAALSALIGILFSVHYLTTEKALTGEFYSLILMATAGMQVMAAANELLTFFVGLELLSIPGYVLAGYFRNRDRSIEAALKYYLPGVFATAFLLYGFALLYGATGSTFFEAIKSSLASESIPITVWVSGLFILTGLSFKVGLVPFHAWAPDVYDGAAAPVSAFLSTGFKAAGFAAMARIFIEVLPLSVHWSHVFVVIAVLTMFIGNLGALVQKSVKRMLAYSSVAHAGYLLVAFVTLPMAASRDVYLALWVYLTAYTLMTGGAFGLLSWLTQKSESKPGYADLGGLGLKYPLAGLAMAVFMFSLAGFPPTAGFFGKYMIFKLAVQHGYTTLAIVGVLNSFLSAYYYLRIIVYLYMKPQTEPESMSSRGFSFQAGLALSTVGSLAAGFLIMLF